MRPIRYRLQIWMRQRWRVLAALSIVIALAGGAALFLLAGAARTMSAPDRYTAWRGALYDVSVQQGQGRPRTAELRALPSTGRVEAVTFVFGGLEASTGRSVDAFVFAGSQDAFGTRLVAGRLPNPSHPGEFAASKSLVNGKGLKLGDRFRLLTFTQAQADAAGFDAGDPQGPSLVATLVGVIAGPADLQDGSQVAVFPPSLLDRGDVGTAATISLASLAPGSTIADMRRELNRLPNGDQFQLDKATWVPPEVRAAVNAQGQGLLIFAAIFVVAAVVVLGQLLSRQLRLLDDERQALLSLGFSRLQLTGEALARASIAAVAGGLGAAALAYAASGFFPHGFVTEVEPHPGRHLDVLVLGVGAVLLASALIVWVLGAAWADGRADRAPRPASLAERMAAAIPSSQAATALRFAFAPTAKRGRQSRTPLFGLTLVFCVMFGALTFGAGLHALVTQPARYGDNFDAVVGAGASQISPEIRAGLARSHDVGALTLYGTTSVSVGAASFDVVGMQTVRGHLVPRVQSGRLPRTSSEVALGSRAARRLRVHVGDEVVVTGATGRRRLRVTGIALVPNVSGADKVGSNLLVTAAGLTAIDSSAAMRAAALDFAPGAPAGASRRLGAAIRSQVGQNDPPGAIVNVRRVRNIPALVAAAVGALALLSLGHLMIVSVRRRRRDLAVLRALGATPRWRTGVIHWQATITATLVLLVAIPVGAAAGGSLYFRFVDKVGADPNPSYPLLWFLAALVGVLALANLVAAGPARRVRRDRSTLTLNQE